MKFLITWVSGKKTEVELSDCNTVEQCANTMFGSVDWKDMGVTIEEMKDGNWESGSSVPRSEDKPSEGSSEDKAAEGSNGSTEAVNSDSVEQGKRSRSKSSKTLTHGE